MSEMLDDPFPFDPRQLKSMLWYLCNCFYKGYLLEAQKAIMTKAPRLGAALRLKCPYCGVEPLQQKGSWFEFDVGCSRCEYRYEREEGYYTGASWMINFPFTATLAFLLVTALVWANLALSSTQIALIATVFVFGFGMFFFPYSQAIWMCIEHRFHPLNQEDVWLPEISKKR